MLLALSVSLDESTAFSFTLPSQASFSRISTNVAEPSSSTTALFAKKKKNNAKAAALEALEALEETFDAPDIAAGGAPDFMDEPLSKKEQMELKKKQKKEKKKQQAAAAAEDANGSAAPAKKLTKKEMLAKALEAEEAMEPPQQEAQPDPVPEPAAPAKKLSKKEQMLMKALEMEELDNAAAQNNDVSDEPKLSKKELKALKKKEEKMAAKQAAKQKKKQEKMAELEAANGVNGDAAVDVNGINGVRTDSCCLVSNVFILPNLDFSIDYRFQRMVRQWRHPHQRKN